MNSVTLFFVGLLLSTLLLIGLSVRAIAKVAFTPVGVVRRSLTVGLGALIVMFGAVVGGVSLDVVVPDWNRTTHLLVLAFLCTASAGLSFKSVRPKKEQNLTATPQANSELSGTAQAPGVDNDTTLPAVVGLAGTAALGAVMLTPSGGKSGGTGDLFAEAAPQALLPLQGGEPAAQEAAMEERHGFVTSTDANLSAAAQEPMLEPRGIEVAENVGQEEIPSTLPDFGEQHFTDIVGAPDFTYHQEIDESMFDNS